MRPSTGSVGDCYDNLPLLAEEVAAGATSCGVCRAVRAKAKAMKRSPDQTPQEVNAFYAKRIENEQRKRTAAGLPPGGRTSRDREHDRRRRARGPVARRAP